MLPLIWEGFQVNQATKQNSQGSIQRGGTLSRILRECHLDQQHYSTIGFQFPQFFKTPDDVIVTSEIPEDSGGRREGNGGRLPSSAVNTEWKYEFNNSASS